MGVRVDAGCDGVRVVTGCDGVAGKLIGGS